VFSSEAEKVRAFLTDVLGLPAADASAGWLIFAMPPAELAVELNIRVTWSEPGLRVTFARSRCKFAGN
jgi:hypothetical protein